MGIIFYRISPFSLTRLHSLILSLSRLRYLQKCKSCISEISFVPQICKNQHQGIVVYIDFIQYTRGIRRFLLPNESLYQCLFLLVRSVLHLYHALSDLIYSIQLWILGFIFTTNHLQRLSVRHCSQLEQLRCYTIRY